MKEVTNMQDRLKNIAEEFEILNNWRKTLDEKEEKTAKDLEDLAEIEELYEYLRGRINNWANEKNKLENKIYESPLITDSLQERRLKNQEALNQIKYASKKLQPKIEGADKQRKISILRNSGFIDTVTFDNRLIQIHPILVEKYKELTSERRIIEKEIQEAKRNQQITQKRKEKEASNNVFNNQEEKYNDTSKKITEESSIPNNSNESNSQINFNKSQEEFQKIKNIIKKNAPYQENDFSKNRDTFPLFDFLKKDKEKEEFISLDSSGSLSEGEKLIKSIEEKMQATPEEEEIEIISVEPPKNKHRLRKKIALAAVGIATFLAVTISSVKGVGNLINKTIPNNQPKIEQELNQDQTERKDIEKTTQQQPPKTKNTTATPQSDDNLVKMKVTNPYDIRIGSNITLNEDARIYPNEYDAYYLNQNSYTPLFKSTDKRVILGVGIITENKGMNKIYANDPRANEKITNLINEGGEIVSILTSNQEKNLTNYKGETLSLDEINKNAEGWYNITDISQKIKGKVL